MTTSTPDNELDRLLDEFEDAVYCSRGDNYTQNEAAKQRAITAKKLIREREAKLAKAYGGCTNCYGKGYATVNDKWVAHDTDQDIGSPGGIVVGGRDFAIRFCDCERGKQLERHAEEIARQSIIKLNKTLKTAEYRRRLDNGETLWDLLKELSQESNPTSEETK